MSKLYNHDTKTWEDLPDADVDSAILAGTHTFETGIDIPAVAPDGSLMMIKSDDAYNAFKDGFRWQNQRDRDSDFDVQNAAIKQRDFDSAGTALVGGALSSLTLGGSDVALNAMGLGEARAASKAVNPIANTIGTVGGVVAGMGAGGLLGSAAKGGQAVFGAGEGLGGALTSGLGAGRAARAVQTVAKAGLGSAAEGAYWGMGEGISEAALGKPEDIVNNMAAGIGLGALTGGAFGTALGGGQAAAPYLKKAFGAVADTGSAVVTKALRNIENKGMRAALNREGETQLAEQLGAQTGTEAHEVARQMIMNGEKDAADKYIAEVTKRSKIFEENQADLRQGLNGFFEKATAAENTAMKDTLQNAGGDVFQARQDIYKTIQSKSNAMKETAVQFADPADGARIMNTSNKLNDVVSALDEIGTPESKQYSQLIGSYNNRVFKPGISEGQEFIGLNNLKRNVINYEEVTKLSDGRVREAMTDLWKFAKNELTAPESGVREELKAFSRDLDADYTAERALATIVGEKTYKASAVARLAADPGKLDAVMPLIDHFPEFGPELTALKAAANNLNARKSVIAQIKDKISNMGMESINGKLTDDDLFKIIQEAGFLRGNPMKRANELREISTFLKGAEGRSPIDKAVYLDRRLNGGTSKLEKYLPYEKELDVLGRLKDVKGRDPGMFGDQTKMGGIGYAVGGPIGAKIGIGISSLVKATNMSPIQIMEGLSRIEKTVNAGIGKLEKASNLAVDALTSSTFRRAGVAYKAYNPDRERFKQVSKNIKDMMDPAKMMDLLSDMPASGAPGVHQALATKLNASVSYLASNMPEDPTAPYSMFPDKSHWVPSDLEMSKFNRRVTVVNDPTTAVNRIAEGTVTPEEVDALKHVYPEIYQGLQEKIISGMMDAKEAPSYEARLILANVFGIPADYSMTPAFVNSMQSSFIPADQGGRPTGSPDAQPRGNPKSSLELKPMESVATSADQVTFKNDLH